MGMLVETAFSLSLSWILRNEVDDTEGRELFLPLPTDCPSGLLKVCTSLLSLARSEVWDLILVLAALSNSFKINSLFLDNT